MKDHKVAPPGADGDPDERALAITALALGAGATQGEHVGDCPDLEHLVAWHERRLQAAAAQIVQRHVADCPRCFALWRELAAVASADPRHQPDQPAAATGWRQRIARWLGLPAGAALPGALAAGMAMLAIGMLLFDSELGRPALPDYEVGLSGAVDYRGGDTDGADRVELRNGTRFELLLRPATAVDDEVAVRVWAGQDGRYEALDGANTTVRRGLVLVEGNVGEDWVLATGNGELLVVLGREGKLPGLNETRLRLGDASQVSTRGWLARRIRIRVDP
jgi:hypothetical protein